MSYLCEDNNKVCGFTADGFKEKAKLLLSAEKKYDIYVSETTETEGVMFFGKGDDGCNEVHVFAKKERALRDLLLAIPYGACVAVSFYEDWMKQTVCEFICGNEVSDNCIKGVKRTYQGIGTDDNVLSDNRVSGSFITSKKDSVLTDIKELNFLKKRIENSKFTVEGKLLVGRAIKDGQLVDKIICTSEFLKEEGANEIVDLAKEKGIPYYVTGSGLMGAVTDTRPLPGIIASVNIAVRSQRDIHILPKESILILDGVANPDNLGMIMRTADASGIDAVVMLSNATHYLNKNAIRGARGAIGRIPIYVSDNDEELFKKLEKESFQIIGMSARAKNEHFYEMEMNDRVAFIVGNESRGMSESSIAHCNDMIRIPMVPGQSSLNVAVSAGIVLYEYVRRQYM